MIYLYEIENNSKTKTVIKKRVPAPGHGLDGLKLYTVHTEAGVSLGDFDTMREARSFCNNLDRVANVQLKIILRRLIRAYWRVEHTPENDQWVEHVERDLDDGRYDPTRR